MLTRLITRVYMPVLLVVLLWPTPGGYYVRLGLAVCVAVIWVLQTRQTKYPPKAAYVPASPKVKYED
ncbi:MAG: hypothetical protein ABSF46_15550 [Terriglobia bacterium]|jgi:hypothetical protein